MLSRKMHPSTCLRCLRASWTLTALLVVIALLGILETIDYHVVAVAAVVLGGLSMALTFHAAEHSGEIAGPREQQVLDEFTQSRHLPESGGGSG